MLMKMAVQSSEITHSNSKDCPVEFSQALSKSGIGYYFGQREKKNTDITQLIFLNDFENDFDY